MHISFHWATGMIIASFASILIQINFWSYLFILGCAVIADFDVIFRKYAQNFNHRMLISHSVYPSIILLVIGGITTQIYIVFGGIAYFVHVFFDLLDWGTNFFYTNKIFGPRFLLSKDEYDRVPELMKKYEPTEWFFVKRYYNSKVMILFEILIALIMLNTIIFISSNYWYFIFGYILTLTLHLIEFFELRHQTSGGKSRVRLIKH